MDKSKIIILGIWGCAILMMAIGISFVQQKPETIDHNNLPKEGVSLQLPETHLRDMNKKEYKAVEEYLKKSYPESKVLSSSKNIMINFPKIESYYEWWAALHSAVNLNPLSTWKIEKMCVGVDCDGHPLSATLTANTLDIQKKPEEKPAPTKKPVPPMPTKKPSAH